jgi:hypothetical protein
MLKEMIKSAAKRGGYSIVPDKRATVLWETSAGNAGFERGRDQLSAEQARVVGDDLEQGRRAHPGEILIASRQQPANHAHAQPVPDPVGIASAEVFRAQRDRVAQYQHGQRIRPGQDQNAAIASAADQIHENAPRASDGMPPYRLLRLAAGSAKRPRSSASAPGLRPARAPLASGAARLPWRRDRGGAGFRSRRTDPCRMFSQARPEHTRAEHGGSRASTDRHG